jgi:hypothetical protein
LFTVSRRGRREPRLLGVESSLHTSQHDVTNPSRVAKADNGVRKVAQVLFVIGADPLGDSR